MVATGAFKTEVNSPERRRRRIGVLVAVFYAAALLTPAIRVHALGAASSWTLGLSCLVPFPGARIVGGTPAAAWLANPILVFCVIRLLRGQFVHWSLPVAAFLLMTLSLSGLDSGVGLEDYISANGLGWWLWAACPLILFVFTLSDAKPIVRKEPPRKW